MSIVKIIIYIIIIIMIPLFLDFLFEITVRKQKRDQIMDMAVDKSKEVSQPIVVFNGLHDGYIYDGTKEEYFKGDFLETVNQLGGNSPVIVLNNVLLYVDNPDEVFDKLREISNDNLYVTNFENNSPRIVLDDKIINTLEKSYYLPGEEIKYNSLTDLQQNIQNMYKFISYIIPYKFIYNMAPVKWLNKFENNNAASK